MPAEKPKSGRPSAPTRGTEIEGGAPLTAERVPEPTVDHHGTYADRDERDLWPCKDGGATLGVGR